MKFSKHQVFLAAYSVLAFLPTDFAQPCILFKVGLSLPAKTFPKVAPSPAN
jgi:hypothetical protein